MARVPLEQTEKGLVMAFGCPGTGSNWNWWLSARTEPMKGTPSLNRPLVRTPLVKAMLGSEPQEESC